MLCLTPATETFRLFSLAYFRAFFMSSTVATWTIPDTRVSSKQLASLIMPPFWIHGRFIPESGRTMLFDLSGFSDPKGLVGVQSFSSLGPSDRYKTFCQAIRAAANINSSVARRIFLSLERFLNLVNKALIFIDFIIPVRAWLIL